ncbi:hypothetical protein J7K50_02230 [bacterium]|nr:hypothetical protein [bacterium]
MNESEVENQGTEIAQREEPGGAVLPAGGALQNLDAVLAALKPEQVTVELYEGKGEIYSIKGSPWAHFGRGSRKLIEESGIHVAELPTVIVDGEEHRTPYAKRDEAGNVTTLHFQMIAIGMNQLGGLDIRQYPLHFDIAARRSEKIRGVLFQGGKLKTELGYIADPVDLEAAKERIRERSTKPFPVVYPLSSGKFAVLDTSHSEFGDIEKAVGDFEKHLMHNHASKCYRRVCDFALGGQATPVDVRSEKEGFIAVYELTVYRMPALLRTLVNELGKAFASGSDKIIDGFISKINQAIKGEIERETVVIKDDFADEHTPDTTPEAEDGEFSDAAETAAKPEYEIAYDKRAKDVREYCRRACNESPHDYDLAAGEFELDFPAPEGHLTKADFEKHYRAAYGTTERDRQAKLTLMGKQLGYFKIAEELAAEKEAGGDAE